MWPWGHLAVGYVVFSAFRRLWDGEPPTDRGAVVLAVATQLPDLIDKPLAWQFGVLDSGVGVAHSLLVGVPVAILAGLYLGATGRPEVGAALALGALTHVLGDLLFGALFGSPPLLPAFLWPLYATAGAADAGLAIEIVDLLRDSRALLGTTAGRAYFLLEAVLIGTTLALWVRDGTPGLWRGR